MCVRLIQRTPVDFGILTEHKLKIRNFWSGAETVIYKQPNGDVVNGLVLGEAGM